MASLFAKLPLINLWAWANGNEYTIDDEATVLTSELKKSDIETDKEYTQLFGQKEKVSAKDKKQSFKEETKVQQSQLSKKEVVVKEKEMTKDEKEIID